MLALWRRMMAVNLDGTFHCIRGGVPAMTAAGWGRIVNIASTAGLVGYRYVAAYCAAKHGVVGLTRALGARAGHTGVTVNAVCPGFTDTDMTTRTIDEHRGARRGRRRPRYGLHWRATRSSDSCARRSRERGRLALPPRERSRHGPGDRGPGGEVM